MTADPSTPKRKLSWWQFVVPLLVLVLLFGVVLPQFIDYAAARFGDVVEQV
jgi:hypothetical protein